MGGRRDRSAIITRKRRWRSRRRFYPESVTYDATDPLLGLEQVPWSERFIKDHRAFKEAHTWGDALRGLWFAQAMPYNGANSVLPSCPLICAQGFGTAGA
jgi:hypothetical protein